jgi:hypothetical protein
MLFSHLIKLLSRIKCIGSPRQNNYDEETLFMNHENVLIDDNKSFGADSRRDYLS